MIRGYNRRAVGDGGRERATTHDRHTYIACIQVTRVLEGASTLNGAWFRTKCGRTDSRRRLTFDAALVIDFHATCGVR